MKERMFWDKQQGNCHTDQMYRLQGRKKHPLLEPRQYEVVVQVE